MEPRPADLTAVVTGASSGIGRAIALELAQRGIGRIWLVARRAHELERVAVEIGPAARVLVADLATAEGRDRVTRGLNRVDVLVNSAGALLSGFFADQAAAEAERLRLAEEKSKNAELALSKKRRATNVVLGTALLVTLGVVVLAVAAFVIREINIAELNDQLDTKRDSLSRLRSSTQY